MLGGCRVQLNLVKTAWEHSNHRTTQALTSEANVFVSVNKTTRQSSSDVTNEVTSETTTAVASLLYTEGFTETLTGSPPTPTAVTPAPETANTKRITKTEPINNPTNNGSKHSTLLTKHLTKKMSTVSESAEIYTNTPPHRATKMISAVTESETEDTGLASGTTNHTELIRFQSAGAATYVSQYVILLAGSLCLVNL